MSHLKKFVEETFKTFIEDTLECDEDAAIKTLSEVKTSFNEHILASLSELLEYDTELDELLAKHLGQDDAMGDKDHLKDRLSYWVNKEGDEDEEECTKQINGINILLDACK